MILYFAYGSNMNIKQMRSRIENNDIEPIHIVLLDNYKLIFPRKSINQKGGVASIIKEKGEEVYGVIYNLNNKEIEILDKYEGEGTAYDKINIDVLIEGKKKSCMTYIAKKEGEFLPSKEYLKKIIAGAEMNKLPNNYINFLKNIKTSD
jgi:cation transport regulator ChaC